MSATTIPVAAGQTMTHALRRALFLLAVAALLVASFAVGRATVHSAKGASVVVPVSQTAPDTYPPHCCGGRPC